MRDTDDFDAFHVLMKAYLNNQAELVPQAELDDGVLDVSIGPEFRSFATPTEAQQNIIYLRSHTRLRRGHH